MRFLISRGLHPHNYKPVIIQLPSIIESVTKHAPDFFQKKRTFSSSSHTGHNKMKALVIKEYGGPEVFQQVELPTPKVIPGYVLIRVLASSVNPVDLKIRTGVHFAMAPAFPAVLHGDVAGIVVEAGKDVTKFKEGDEVFGCAGGFKGHGGALAEYMLVDQRLIAHKPKSINMVSAAALPLVAITAWEALIDRSQLKPNQNVLIHGATGGVGHIAIQLARWIGANTYATASSPEKLALAEKLGVTAAINYKEQTVQDYVNKYTAKKGFDVVVDVVGGENIEKSFEACAINGCVSVISTRSPCDLTPLHRKALTVHRIFMPSPLLYDVGRERHGQILSQISILVDDLHVKPLIDKVYDFSQVGEAHTRLESGAAVGKIVLQQNLSMVKF